MIANTVGRMDLNNDTLLGKLLFFFAVIALSTLGSISRLLSEAHLQSSKENSEDIEITRGLVITYIVCGITAGLIISLILHQYYGFSFGLVGLAGAAGFGSVQILSTCALALNEIIKRLMGKK